MALLLTFVKVSQRRIPSSRTRRQLFPGFNATSRTRTPWFPKFVVRCWAVMINVDSVSDTDHIYHQMYPHYRPESNQVSNSDHQCARQLKSASSISGELPPPAPRACFGRRELINSAYVLLPASPLFPLTARSSTSQRCRSMPHATHSTAYTREPNDPTSSTRS